jgi:hypothetical protein
MPADISAASASAQGSELVVAAIRRGSAATGAQFDYLMKTAMRESSLNADAKATTSSAAGLFQFIEQTWLGAVKTYGARHGLADAAADIVKDADGRHRVADAARREEILNLRFDPRASAALAGELAAENGRFLARSLGRAADAADLYAAHFLGPAGAVKLMSAAAGAKAADILPAAAEANRNVFYDGARAKTVGEVISSIRESMRVAAPASQSASEGTEEAPAPAKSVAAASAPNVQSAPLSARLSFMTISVLQALDPTRLFAEKDADDRV